MFKAESSTETAATSPQAAAPAPQQTPSIVIYHDADGARGFKPVLFIEEALEYVETLLNSEAATEARVFRLQEIEIDLVEAEQVVLVDQAS